MRFSLRLPKFFKSIRCNITHRRTHNEERDLSNNILDIR